MDEEGRGDDVSTIAQQRYLPSASLSATFTIVVVEGPDRGLSFCLDGTQSSRVLLGKSSACDLCLTDPGVSRRHAALEIDGGRLRVTDLGSTNGTVVDNVSIREAHLEGGETLRIGGTQLRVERGPAPQAPSLPVATQFGRVIGWSREMRRLYPLCARLAASAVPVIIEGETGTGKEVLAESLHEEGPRARAPFIVFDCTAVPASLVESELFGHERGAFTGAVSLKHGLLEQAHGGTVLIDEIGDLELALQPKLLRALERGEARRVGGTQPIRFDIRVLAATRRDLDHEIQAGRFREDLFHRLAVARIELPPLRRRRGDIALLADHFAKAFGGEKRQVPGELLKRWEDYEWPGNVRELRNAVARWLALGEHADLSTGGKQTAPRSAPGDLVGNVLERRLPFVAAREAVIEEFERRYLDQTLAEHGGNVTQAAKASGIGRRYIHKIRARHQNQK
jgi:DNA-binding NtrC family response regulator